MDSEPKIPRRQGRGAKRASPWQGLLIPPAFHDSARLRKQALRAGLVPLQADFLRCLALAAWATARPSHRSALGLAPDARLDDCLLAGLRHLGWPLQSLEDSALDICWELRREFCAGTKSTRSAYHVAPSYHDRLRLELLIDAWERVSLRAEGDDIVLDLLGETLAQASATFAAHLHLPFALLRRAAAERRLRASAAAGLRESVQASLAASARRGVHHLAIAAALDGDRDLIDTLRRHGDALMCAAVKDYLTRHPGVAQAELEPGIARLRQHLWSPVSQAAPRKP